MTNARAIPDFDEKEPHERGFAAYFDQRIKPVLPRLEEIRVAARRAWWIRTGIVAALVPLGGLILYLLWGWRFWYFLIGLAVWLLALAVLFWLIRRAARSYARARKRELIPEMLAFFDEFEYEPRGRISKRILADSHLFEDWDRYDSEDLISGKYRGREFDFAEASLKREGRKAMRKLFRGFILALELPEAVEGVTIGVRDKEDVFKDFEQVVQRHRGLTLVPVADRDFEDDFEVYSTRNDAAPGLIDDRLIGALAAIRRLHDAHGIEFGFNERIFLLKIATDHDLFDDAPLRRTALSPDDTRRLLAEIALVLEIVDTAGRGTAAVENG